MHDDELYCSGDDDGHHINMSNETGEADSGSAENGRSSSQSLHENTGRVDPLSIESFAAMPAASVSRNLFPTDNEQEDESSRRPSNNGTSPTDSDGAHQMKSDNGER